MSVRILYPSTVNTYIVFITLISQILMFDLSSIDIIFGELGINLHKIISDEWPSNFAIKGLVKEASGQ